MYTFQWSSSLEMSIQIIGLKTAVFAVSLRKNHAYTESDAPRLLSVSNQANLLACCLALLGSPPPKRCQGTSRAHFHTSCLTLSKAVASLPESSKRGRG